MALDRNLQGPPEALRNWVRQAEIDGGVPPGTTIDDAQRRDCPTNGEVARHADLLVGEEGSLTIETLVGVSPLNTEELLEEPSLADAAVAGATGPVEPDDPDDLAEPSAEEMAIARELVRSARARGVAMTGRRA